MERLHYKDVVFANPVYLDVRSRNDVDTDVEV